MVIIMITTDTSVSVHTTAPHKHFHTVVLLSDQGQRCPSWCTCLERWTLECGRWWPPSSSGPSHVTWHAHTLVPGRPASPCCPCSLCFCRHDPPVCFRRCDISSQWQVCEDTSFFVCVYAWFGVALPILLLLSLWPSFSFFQISSSSSDGLDM